MKTLLWLAAVVGAYWLYRKSQDNTATAGTEKPLPVSMFGSPDVTTDSEATAHTLISNPASAIDTHVEQTGALVYPVSIDAGQADTGLVPVGGTPPATRIVVEVPKIQLPTVLPPLQANPVLSTLKGTLAPVYLPSANRDQKVSYGGGGGVPIYPLY